MCSSLDDPTYHCSTQNDVRILDKHSETRERRVHRLHPFYARPELGASGPNQAWSWDITKLRRAVKYSYSYLYVILDIYSGYAVGWTVQNFESETAERDFIDETIMETVHGGKTKEDADKSPPGAFCPPRPETEFATADGFGSTLRELRANKHRSFTKLFHAGVSKLLTRAARNVEDF